MWSDHFVDAGGVRLAARDYGGEGAPVVLVHGHYGNLANFDELGPLLAQRHRVVAYDQRGHGWSETGPVSVEDFNRDLEAVAQTFGFERPWLYGGSFGTLVCLGYVNSGRPFAGLISEDGRAGDFAPMSPEGDAPPPDPTIVSAKSYATILEGYAAYGTVGEASTRRGTVLRPDGRFEIRPSRAGLHAKETAFPHVRVLDAYRACGGRALYLAANGSDGVNAGEGRANVDALASDAGVTVRWFDTGHWISAAVPQAVADEVAAFVECV